MVTLEAAASLSIFSRHLSRSRKSVAYPHLSFSYCRPCISFSVPFLSHSFCNPPLSDATRNLSLVLCSTVQEVELDEESEKAPTGNVKRKVIVLNLPWSFSVADIKDLFGQCGTVADVEIIKKDGRKRGFAFVTMASGEEAQAVVDKFNSQEVSGRVIRVEFAKRLKKPASSPPKLPNGQTRHHLYVSNLAWKVRSAHLREFFSADFKPLSARVVFDSPDGRSAGYGFVSFATREEAEAAIYALNEKELMGRPLLLKFSQRNVKESESQKNEEEENVTVSEAEGL